MVFLMRCLRDGFLSAVNVKPLPQSSSTPFRDDHRALRRDSFFVQKNLKTAIKKVNRKCRNNKH